MALEFIGTDPNSRDRQSPTVFVDADSRELVLQSWDASPKRVPRRSACFIRCRGTSR